MRKIFGFIALLAGMIASPVMAQQTTYDPNRVIKSIEASDLAAIVGSLGDTIEDRKDADRLVVALTGEGVRYIVYGTACDIGEATGCQGVMIQARYDVPEETTLDRVNQANINEGAIMTWMAEDRSTLAFVKYVVLDHGVTMANLRENIAVLLAVSPSALAYAKGEK